MITPARQRWEKEHKRWLERVVCEVCGVVISRSHVKSHNESQTHQRATAMRWEWLPSDEDFSRFLHSIRPSHLQGYERRLFRHYRRLERIQHEREG